MAEVLGKISFLETPDVAGVDVLLNGGGVPAIISGTLAARPTAAITGRLYLDTTNNVFYRDNGTSWDNLTALVQVSGTATEIIVTPAVVGTPAIIGIADDAVLPGTGAVSIPTGTTAQRKAVPVAGDHRQNSTLGYAEVYNGAVWQPQGRVLQVVSGTIAASSGTTTVPLDNTIPQVTEGNQIWTTSFTPISAASRLIISFEITAASSIASATLILSAFTSASANSIGSNVTRTSATAQTAAAMGLQLTFAPASTATITISARLGGSAAATTYCNIIGATTLGGALVSQYTITEVL